MTDAGEKWAWEQSAKAMCAADYVQSHAHALSPMAAEFWIRVFFADVLTTAKKECNHTSEPVDSCVRCRGRAFDELKRELLGTKGR